MSVENLMHSNFFKNFYRRKSIRSTTVLVSAPKWPTRTSGNLARNNCEPTKGTSDCKPDLTKERRRPASVPSAILGTCKKDRGTDDFFCFILFLLPERANNHTTQRVDGVFSNSEIQKKREAIHPGRWPKSKATWFEKNKTKTYCAY